MDLSERRERKISTTGDIRVGLPCAKEDRLTGFEVHVVQQERTEYADVAGKLRVQTDNQINNILRLRLDFGTSSLVSGYKELELRFD